MAAFEDTQNLSINKVTDITNANKMDLIVLSATPAIDALWNLMEMIIIGARDEAMEANPANPAEQLSKMTTAHGMEKFYRRIRNSLKFITQEHLNEAQQLEYNKQMQTPEEIEKIILSQ